MQPRPLLIEVGREPRADRIGIAGAGRRKAGAPTSELDEYKQSLRPVRQLYGLTLAADFGPISGLSASSFPST